MQPDPVDETPDRRPRHYAHDIKRLTTREARRDALAAVPEHLRDMVAVHVTHAFRCRRRTL